MQQNGKVHFPTRKQLVKKHMPFVLAKCMDHYVLPMLTQCDTISITFDLWTNRIGFDTFALLINFLDWDWYLAISISTYLRLQILMELHCRAGETFLVEF